MTEVAGSDFSFMCQVWAVSDLHTFNSEKFITILQNSVAFGVTAFCDLTKTKPIG